MADARRRLGHCLIHAGIDGRRHLHDALGLYEQDNDRLGQWETLNDLTFAYRLFGELVAARQEFDRIEMLANQLDVPMLKGSSKLQRSDAAFIAGDIDRALAPLEPMANALPAFTSLAGQIRLNIVGRLTDAQLESAPHNLPSDAISNYYLIRTNKAVQRANWDEALRLADEAVRFDLERGQWWEAVSKVHLAITAVLMGRRQPDGSFPLAAVEEARLRLTSASWNAP